jgi:non-ribosomal peptide synthetase component F
MGIFVNMLAMRNRPCSDKRYREFLLEVKETALNAFENQDCQFDELVMKLGIQGNLNRNPLFDTVFEMRFKDNNNERTNHMKEGNRSPQDNINVSLYPLGHREAVFDLILWAVEYEDTITLRLTYSSALFKRTKVEKLTKHYIDILSQVVEDYDIELKGISISHGLLKLGSRSLQEAQGDFGF